jgi:hypothetical protein
MTRTRLVNFAEFFLNPPCFRRAFRLIATFQTRWTAAARLSSTAHSLPSPIFGSLSRSGLCSCFNIYNS